MDVYTAKMKSDRIFDKLKFIIVVRGYLKNKEIIVDVRYPAASMSNLKHFSAYDSNHKSMLQKLYFIVVYIIVD